ncbi:MAG: hypothetical protein IJR99_08735 [Kiritimatiellae bacterium]|nr:hypothetical protein [Kiritimatiellia bacterium]
MKRMVWIVKRWFAAAAITAVLAAAFTASGETVTNVRGQQREKSNLVDIYYDLEATEGGSYTVKVEIEGRTNEVNAATFTGDVGEGVASGKNKHVVWDAGTDWPGKKGDVKAKVTATKAEHDGCQLWEGGPYWADRNVGASTPEDYGLYFWWGDTVGYHPSGNTFGFSFGSANCPTYNKSVSTLQSEGWITSGGVLAPAHDAAHVHWGGAWRMPTYQELNDLCYNKCDWTWTTMNGVNGWVVRGRGVYASNSIFLPAAGFGRGTSLSVAGSSGEYWSSVPGSDYDYFSGGLNFYSGGHSTDGNIRSNGFSVRPVQGFSN